MKASGVPKNNASGGVFQEAGQRLFQRQKRFPRGDFKSAGSRAATARSLGAWREQVGRGFGPRSVQQS